MHLDESLFSQFLAEREIAWTGIDFSQAKLTKDGFDYPIEVLHRYFNEWNLLIISDQKKYDIRRAFRKPIMHYDLSLVTKKNRAIKASQVLTSGLKMSHQYSDENIMEYCQSLDIPVQSNFTLTIIVESFDQPSKAASLWLVLIHSESGQVVLCEKFLKTPAGFGIRNYWARVFYNLFFDIQNSAYQRWVNLVK